MELFDLIEFASYVSPVAERLQQAANRNASSATAGGLQHSQHPYWKQGTSSFFDAPEDLDIRSSDFVHFHVHRARLLAVSSNMFDGRLRITNPQQNEEGKLDAETLWPENAQRQSMLLLQETGAVLNILLFAAFNRSHANDDIDVSEISLQDLALAVVALKKYGIPADAAISEGSMMFDAFASHCQSGPGPALQIYSIAAHNAPDLHALAVYASQFLLSLNLANITDQIAGVLGGVYLQRLHTLHMERVQEFKRLIVAFPQRHGPLPHCNDPKPLVEAWSSTRAYLAWTATPNISDSKIDDAKVSVLEKVICNACKGRLQDRFQSLKYEWSLVKRTI